MFSWPLVLYLVSRKRADPKGFYPYILQIQLSNLLNRFIHINLKACCFQLAC